MTSKHRPDPVCDAPDVVLPFPVPEYWRAVQRFVLREIPAIPWGQRQGDPSSRWVVYADGNALWPDNDGFQALAGEGDPVDVSFARVLNDLQAADAHRWDYPGPPEGVFRSINRVVEKVACQCLSIHIQNATLAAQLKAMIMICDGEGIKVRLVDRQNADDRWGIYQSGFVYAGWLKGQAHVF